MRPIDADALVAKLEADAEEMEEPIAKMFTYAAINDVKHAPTVEPMQWIPVSERLPRDDEPFYVLCCDDRGEQMIGNPFESEDSDTGYSAESEECYMYNVVAWMPLPEPYKGGDADGT